MSEPSRWVRPATIERRIEMGVQDLKSVLGLHEELVLARNRRCITASAERRRLENVRALEIQMDRIGERLVALLVGE